jgi:hypothetical protein
MLRNDVRSATWKGSTCSDFLPCFHRKRGQHAPKFQVHLKRGQHAPIFFHAFTSRGVNMLRFSSMLSPQEGSTCSDFLSCLHIKRGQHAPIFFHAFPSRGVNMLRFSSLLSPQRGSTCSDFLPGFHLKGGSAWSDFLPCFHLKRGQHAPIFFHAFTLKGVNMFRFSSMCSPEEGSACSGMPSPPQRGQHAPIFSAQFCNQGGQYLPEWQFFLQITYSEM